MARCFNASVAVGFDLDVRGASALCACFEDADQFLENFWGVKKELLVSYKTRARQFFPDAFEDDRLKMHRPVRGERGGVKAIQFELEQVQDGPPRVRTSFYFTIDKNDTVVAQAQRFDGFTPTGDVQWYQVIEALDSLMKTKIIGLLWKKFADDHTLEERGPKQRPFHDWYRETHAFDFSYGCYEKKTRRIMTIKQIKTQPDGPLLPPWMQTESESCYGVKLPYGMKTSRLALDLDNLVDEIERVKVCDPNVLWVKERIVGQNTLLDLRIVEPLDWVTGAPLEDATEDLRVLS
jgi:hypothetical protein